MTAASTAKTDTKQKIEDELRSLANAFTRISPAESPGGRPFAKVSTSGDTVTIECGGRCGAYTPSYSFGGFLRDIGIAADSTDGSVRVNLNQPDLETKLMDPSTRAIAGGYVAATVFRNTCFSATGEQRAKAVAAFATALDVPGVMVQGQRTGMVRGES